MNFLRSLLSIRYYVLVALLAYGVFVWAGLRGIRLLGDDNENPEGTRTSGARGGHARFYHK
ncbi:hypothetical protein KBK19_10420 [Microvirga sp. STR05]|uniref:Uncharacterized protein n=1 Tax=Hymenobacter duratus TaxID=2771356 RepID=A0ABR8JLN5_9BACT|nr:hypothetical protein [Hymenobacter duratus]MBD2715449.1 hypothetical protein [Hymenobacter duratus]MBR7950357.1 hypothetical protein [Microvirga sp. STR05]